MHNHWQSEILRLAFVLLVSLIIGQLSGYVWEALIISLLLYAIRNIYNLQRLLAWLGHQDTSSMPNHLGIWADIYAKISHTYRLREQHTQQLQTQLQQLHESTTALPDAVIALGTHGEIEWFNEAAQKYLALRNPQDIRQPLFNLFRNPAIVRYLKAGDFTQPLEVPAPGVKDRTLSIRMTRYGDGRHLLLAQDITERMRTDQVRKEFVANVSHELRTPLTVISGFIENMQLEQSTCPEKWRKPLALMDQQASRMRRLVEDLLLLARLEGGVDQAHRELVDIAALAEEITAEARSLAGDALDITLKVESTKQLMGNASQLRSAFTNLISNAVKYTPGHGNVWISWDTDATGGYFTVQDEGEGIAKQHLPRLTERFYRVDVGRSRDQGGTGLGLAIVKHVLQAHGAELLIQSEVGKGSRFCCQFPPSRLRMEP